MPTSDLALDQPLPPALSGSGQGWLTRYRRWPVFSRGWRRGRLLVALLPTAGLLLTLALLRSHVPLGEWCARWPYLFGVLAGLAWWLWLPPSFLGWVIVAISMIGAVRLPAASQRWPRVTEHGTTVIRNGG